MDRRGFTCLLETTSTARTCIYQVRTRVLPDRGRQRTDNGVVMGLVTYVLLSTLIAGLQGKFKPELLGYTATTSSIAVITEIMILKLGCYLLSISSQSQLFDLIAYSGYKFVGIIVTIAIAELFSGGNGTGGWVGWTIFLYTFLANSLFLVSKYKTFWFTNNNY